MYIVEHIDNFKIDNVYFLSSLENTVIDDGTFAKLVYSTPDITINGVYLLCTFNNTSVEKIAYNKFKVSWSHDKNVKLIEQLKNIEKSIMDKYGKAHYCTQLSNFLDYHNFRIFSEENSLTSNNDFMLRISGIWEKDNNTRGITYKFLDVHGI